MGGLRRGMPVTFWCTTIGLGALVGVPPLAGFWSKDEILHVAGTERRLARPCWSTSPGWPRCSSPPAYATRLWLRTFFGAGPVRRRPAHAHEPPPAMAWPVRGAGRAQRACSGFAGARRRRSPRHSGRRRAVQRWASTPRSRSPWAAARRRLRGGLGVAAPPGRTRPACSAGAAGARQRVLPRRRAATRWSYGRCRRWPARSAGRTSPEWTVRSRAPAAAPCGWAALVADAAPGRPAPGRHRRARRRRPARPGRRRDRGGVAVTTVLLLLIADAAVPALGALAAVALPARARPGRPDRGHRRRRRRVRGQRWLLAWRSALPVRLASAIRPWSPSTCPGCPAWTCDSTSESTASPTRWSC